MTDDRPPVSRGFVGRRPAAGKPRLPPGQYETKDFPVLSAGPTPRVPLATWQLSLRSGDDVVTWSWDEYRKLPRTTLATDIHCVTKWSKFGTRWQGVSIDDLIASATAHTMFKPKPYVMAHCYGGYTTNVPLADLAGGKGIVADTFEDEPLDPEHGGPARLLVPHLYFWKSAKWVRELEFLERDEPGFWEDAGYHIYGDPWREQRYTGDP